MGKLADIIQRNGGVIKESWDIKGMVNDYLKDVYFKSDEFRNMVHEATKQVIEETQYQDKSKSDKSVRNDTL